MSYYNISVDQEGRGTATFIHDGEITTVNQDHPGFARITHALATGGDPADFLNAEPTKLVESLSDRVTLVDGETLLFDGEEIDSRVARTVLRYRNEGRDTTGIVRFLERLAANPSLRARRELFDWVEHQQLTIDPEGYFIAHKGVNVADVDSFDEDLLDEAGWFVTVAEPLLTSVSSGKARVNGVPFEGLIPNWIGATVSMERTDVDDDHGRDCSDGLHIGSFSYARSFARRLVEVRVDPADVVTVPRYDTQKLRCCRYTVLALQEQPDPVLSHWESEAGWDDGEAWEALEEADVPLSFLGRLRARFSGSIGDDE